MALNTLFTLESDAVHPYQNLKVEENTPTISTNNKKHMISVQSSAASDKTKCELNEYDQVVDPSTNKSSIEKTERIDYPALPEPATTKSWDFDFHFEPITLDLVLPNIDLIDRDRAY